MNSFIHGNNTSDIRLVAALGAMGIKCDEQNAGGALQTRSGVVRTWNLSQVSNCGKWKLGELLSWWRDREFHTTNPSHVFMRVKSAMASCKGFSELLTVHAGIHTVKRGDTLIAVASSTPNIHPVNPLSHTTDDFNKVAAFLSMGFEATEPPPNGSHRSCQIANMSITGMPFAPLDIAWNDNRFHETNPQHPFAYVKAALWNYRHLVSAIKTDKPMVEISRGESFAYLHPDCSSKTEAEILSQFDK